MMPKLFRLMLAGYNVKEDQVFHGSVLTQYGEPLLDELDWTVKSVVANTLNNAVTITFISENGDIITLTGVSGDAQNQQF